MGLAANAQEESLRAGGATAAGDALSGYSGVKLLAFQKTAINGKCSFGYWQLNVCPDTAIEPTRDLPTEGEDDGTGGSYQAKKDGGGTAFIKHFKLDRQDPDTIFTAITNEAKQFEFVAKYLGTLGLTPQEKDPQTAGQQIAILFEDCAECDPVGGKKDEQTVLRGAVAAKLAETLAAEEEGKSVAVAAIVEETSGTKTAAVGYSGKF